MPYIHKNVNECHDFIYEIKAPKPEAGHCESAGVIYQEAIPANDIMPPSHEDGIV